MMTGNKILRIQLLKYCWLSVFMLCLNFNGAFAQGHQGLLVELSEQMVSGTPDGNASSHKLMTVIQLEEGRQTLREVLGDIADQAGLKLSYSKQLIPLEKTVDVRQTRVTTEQALWSVLEGTSLRFGISATGQLFFFEVPEVNFFEVPEVNMATQQETVIGTVTDAATSETLPGVNVLVKGTTIGTATDANGEYELTVESLQDTLVFSFIGYQRQEVPIGGRHAINVALQPQTVMGDELVVVGYGTQEEINVTGSVSSVKAEEINAIPTGDVASRLQGRVSGVRITNDNSPGGNSVVRIRGIGSINENSPLYVVDGVPVSNLDGINPNDIESMSVLKDAASSAIYGSRAANGVIVITTKRGAFGEGLDVSFGARYGFQQVQKQLDLLNARELGQKKWQELRNDGYEVGDPGWGDLQYGNGPEPVLPDYVFPGGAMEGEVDESSYSYPQPYNGITRANKEGTDWLGEIFSVAPIQEYNLGISGGGESARFSISSGYMDNTGILNHTEYSRYNLRANSDFIVTDWLEIGQSLGGAYTERRGSGGTGSINQAMRISPLLPVYDIQGNFAGTKSPKTSNAQNPVAELYRSRNDFARQIRLLANAYIQVNISENISVRSTLGTDIRDSRSKSYNLMDPEFTQTNYGNALNENTQRGFQYNWANTISFTKTLNNDHNFSGLIGSEAVYNHNEGFSAGRSTFAFEDINYMILDSGEGSQVNSGSFDEWSLFSYFGRLNYDYKQKYLLEAVIRRDASSRFTGENRWGAFPAFSFGWRALEDLGEVSFIDDLKLRLSWGQNGNDNVGNYNQYSTYQSDLFWSYYNITGASETESQAGFWRNRIGNPEAKWETNTTSNLGLDLSFLDYRLEAKIDVYTRTTSDMLYPNTRPDVFGAASVPDINIGEMRNKGIDVLLSYQGGAGSDLGYNITANFSHYTNEVVRLNLDPNEFRYGSILLGSPYTITEAGAPVSSHYGYVVEGYFNTPQEIENHEPFNPNAQGIDTYSRLGAFKYKDVNGDGIIDSNDRTIIGSPHPDFTYGLNLDLNYKSWDLTMFFQGSYGNEIMNHVKREIMFNRYDGNYLKERLYESWTPERYANGEKITAPITTNNDSQLSQPSTWLLEDGSYFKLKNLQLGYTIPEAIMSQINIDRLRLYVQASNLFTLTNYSGLDPELSSSNDLHSGVDQGVYPTPRIMMMGLNINF